MIGQWCWAAIPALRCRSRPDQFQAVPGPQSGLTGLPTRRERNLNVPGSIWAAPERIPQTG